MKTIFLPLFKKTAFCLLFGWLGMVQTGGAAPIGCKDDNGHPAPCASSGSPLDRPLLAAPVLPAQAKTVTRFSTGSAHLRQQVQAQSGNRN
jgi:hypothetical protein